MVFSVEAYVGVEGEEEGLKLEEQVLVRRRAWRFLATHRMTNTWRATETRRPLRPPPKMAYAIR
jgi:hypothetical protein